MDLGLEGKRALVTGGTGLIGLAMARRLGLEGAGVTVCGRGTARLDAAITALRHEGIAADGVVCDVRAETEVVALMDWIRQRHGGLDILVNNPGGVMQPGPFRAISPQTFVEGFELNVASIVRVTQAALPLMRGRAGRIVNLGAFYTHSVCFVDNPEKRRVAHSTPGTRSAPSPSGRISSCLQQD